jgi:hypothetical protein
LLKTCVFTIDGIYFNIINCIVACLLPVDMVCVELSRLFPRSQGFRIDLGTWGSHGVDSVIPYDTVIMRVMVSGWDTKAFGMFHISLSLSFFFFGGGGRRFYSGLSTAYCASQETAPQSL